jgi:hypothetical protein
MVAGKIKKEIILKFFLAFSFVCFLIINLIQNDLSNGSLVIPTNNVYKIIITGGSNSMYGLDAASFQKSFGLSVNLSLPNEGGVFSNYVNWLNKINASTHIVIYSPISFWDVKENQTAKSSLIQQFRSLFPKISLMRYIANLFIQPENYPRNEVGDLTEFNCKNYFQNWKSTKNYAERAIAASHHFKYRMSIIRDVTHADIVVLRIPPLFVSEIDKPRIEKEIREVVASYRTQGILVLEEPFLLTTNATLICDYAHHPNEAGRAFFTQNYINALKKIL